MVQNYIEMLTILDNGGMISMHESNYVIVKEYYFDDCTEWLLIISEDLDAALVATTGRKDDCCEVSPYPSRAEAFSAAYAVLFE